MSDQSTIEEGKTIAMISYLSLIGLIIAFVMNNDKKNSFASFHIRQFIGICLLSFALWIVLIILTFVFALISPDLGSMIGGVLTFVIYGGLFVLWLLGFLSALQGKEKTIPVVGDKFQQWFKNI